MKRSQIVAVKKRGKNENKTLDAPSIFIVQRRPLIMTDDRPINLSHHDNPFTRTIIFQTSSRFNESLTNGEKCHQPHLTVSIQSNFSPKLYRKNEPPEPQDTREKADDFQREIDLIDLTKVTNDSDLYSADIEFMNNYLKSLPDYSKMNQPIAYNPQSAVRLREHPTPKPFYTTANDYSARSTHKSSTSVQQSPKNQRKQINPLSKSNSVHTFSKRNIGQSIEKETTFSDEQKNKISRSTSSTTIPVKETTDLMGFMRKPSSLMNIFKKLGSQNPPQATVPQPKTSSNNVRKNVHDSKTPSVSRSKNISDFWNENLHQQTTSSSKFGWNYQKIMPHLGQKQAPPPPPQHHHQMHSEPAKPTSLVVVKKLDPIEPSKPTISNVAKKVPIDTNAQQTVAQKQQPQQLHQPHQHHHQHHSHSQHYPKTQNQAISHFAKKLTESPKLQRSTRPLHDLENEQKLLKSSSNSHIYMNQDDPNYFKNLHKITKSLDNATNNIIGNNKSSYKRSISNTSVPSYLGSSPQQSHMYFPPPNQPPHIMMMHPATAPISFYPPISYKPPQDFHMHQRSGSKSNIPLCYKYPLNRSSSNTSMMSGYNGTAIGFYSVQDPLLWQATPSLHHINKSSSSSCIYAKTLSQPTHLSKNNDIFAKYKPIVSDDEESESEEDDISKQSNQSKGSINKVPAPAPFKKQPQAATNNYPPFTKLNSIQIPINGQLPSAFKNNSNNSTESLPKSQAEENVDQIMADSFNASRKTSRTSSITLNANSSSKPQTVTSSVPGTKSFCNQSNIFYNFMNPMAATQTQSINQMHLQPQLESVGCYTPYTKYLSDRKYFDVAMSDGMNLSSGTKPEQRRTSKIPTLAEAKAKPANNIAELAATTKLCDRKQDEENPTSGELFATAVTTINASTMTPNEMVAVDPKEILSAFDPFFTEDPAPQPSTSNKLHQLLTTVANEWNTSCDQATAMNPTMMVNCKGDRYGSSQYEVVKRFRSLLWTRRRLRIAFLLKT